MDTAEALALIDRLRAALATATGKPLAVIELEYPDPPVAGID